MRKAILAESRLEGLLVEERVLEREKEFLFPLADNGYADV